ncbi:hypothetical protein AAHA92_06712 [Salvia divinorum]|uniref:Retrotransposon gag domain-containing protein n=1 Tax=Salvia divinorum TaxID=28513 RepID=A0ABD1I6L7_SALDI
MRTISQEDVTFLLRQVQMLVEEKAAEKAAKEAEERRNRDIIPVMQMFNHGNMVTIPTISQINANNFELKIYLIQRVEQHPFLEEPRRMQTDTSSNAAKEWFECLPVERIYTWNGIVALFFDKYYPPGTKLKLKSEICQFIQGHDEPLYEVVTRFKALLRKCPNHRFSIEHQVGLLYNGFTEKISAMLDAGANGGFLRKGGKEAMEVIEEFTANSRGWSNERHNMKIVAAIEEQDESNLVKELAALRVRMDKMETTRKEEPIPPASVISLPQKDAPLAVRDVNYVQNSSGPNQTYNNYRPNQGGGFNVSKGGVVEPSKKDDKCEQEILKILEVLEEDRKTNETKIGVVEAIFNNLETGLNTIVSTVTVIKIQMDQIQKEIEEEMDSSRPCSRN